MHVRKYVNTFIIYGYVFFFDFFFFGIVNIYFCIRIVEQRVLPMHECGRVTIEFELTLYIWCHFVTIVHRMIKKLVIVL